MVISRFSNGCASGVWFIHTKYFYIFGQWGYLMFPWSTKEASDEAATTTTLMSEVLESCVKSSVLVGSAVLLSGRSGGGLAVDRFVLAIFGAHGGFTLTLRCR